MYEKFAPQYLTQHIITIPTSKDDSKIPVVKGWNAATKENVIEWIAAHDGAHIGMLLGATNKIIGLDLDFMPDDAPDFFSKCPKSPVIIQGARGPKYLFRYNKEEYLKIDNKILPNGEVVSLEILSCNENGGDRFTVLPPSIHPVTKLAYKWVFEGDLRLNNLPYLQPEFYEYLKDLNEQCASLEKDIKIGGRNSTMVKFISALVLNEPMLIKEGDVSLIARKVMDYDIAKHGDHSLFNDKTETITRNGKVGQLEAATKFCLNVVKSLWLKIKDKQTAFECVEDTKAVVAPLDGVIPHIELATLSPFLEEGISFIQKNAGTDRNSAIFGALSAYGAAFSNTCVDANFNKSMTPLFTCFVGASGSGKSNITDSIKRILYEVNRSVYKAGSFDINKSILPISVTDPNSEKGLIQSLEKHKNVVLINTEMANADIENFYNKNKGYFSETFSSTGCFVHGKTIGGDKNSSTITYGNIFSPCLSIIGGAQDRNFDKFFTPESGAQGYVKRFLFCYIPKTDTPPSSVTLNVAVAAFFNRFGVYSNHLKIKYLGETTHNIAGLRTYTFDDSLLAVVKVKMLTKVKDLLVNKLTESNRLVIIELVESRCVELIKRICLTLQMCEDISKTAPSYDDLKQAVSHIPIEHKTVYDATVIYLNSVISLINAVDVKKVIAESKLLIIEAFCEEKLAKVLVEGFFRRDNFIRFVVQKCVKHNINKTYVTAEVKKYLLALVDEGTVEEHAKSNFTVIYRKLI